MNKPQAYKYDFDGACAPGSGWALHQTFSYGIFQWLPKKSGIGLKRSKVVKRIRGHVMDEAKIKQQAQDFCNTLNANIKV
jgi:hypothetical protein